jgi:hypothetical protein
LKLGAPVTAVFADLIASALRARGHTVTTDEASSEVTIAAAVNECIVKLLPSRSVTQVNLRIAVRRPGTTAPVADREHFVAVRDRGTLNLKRIFLANLERALDESARSLANDDRLEAELQRAAATS